MAMTQDDAERKLKAARKENFQKFKEQPTTRMLMSMIPPSQDHPEVLETLLEAAFEQGFGVGTAQVSLMMIGAMVDRAPPRG